MKLTAIFQPRTVLITFDDSTRIYDFADKSLNEVLLQVSQIEAGGGTSFSSAIREIRTLIEAMPTGSACFLVFLTDGCDTSCRVTSQQVSRNGVATTRPSLATNTSQAALRLADGLHGALTSKSIVCPIHALGFGSHHDAAMLSSLARAGTSTGTSLYLQDDADISNGIDIMSDLFEGTSFITPIKLRVGRQNLVIILEPLEESEGSTAARSDNGGQPPGCTFKGSVFLKHMPTQANVLIQVTLQTF
ncbi:hypothetical protein WJX73_003417 [Symbiochloris irregularis]|uniref:VWFA domain-containing protein n=1 Tax=Symbiochloris irregularis TaxID=706552 RepID=A0AAW1NWX1_9CHLO